MQMCLSQLNMPWEQLSKPRILKILCESLEILKILESNPLNKLVYILNSEEFSIFIDDLYSKTQLVVDFLVG